MVDVTQQIESVRRIVADREVDGAPVKAVTVSQTYDVPVTDVWDAMTTPERIPRWLMPVTGDLRLGGSYQLEGNAGGTILECDAPHRLRVSWEYGGGVSWVTVTLTPDGPERATVEIEHLAPVDEHWDEFGPGAAGIGWDSILLALALHLSGGSLGGPAEAAAWSASAEGLEFMRASGEEWCAAHVAAGEPEPAARAAADRSITAYTAPPEAVEAPQQQ